MTQSNQAVTPKTFIKTLRIIGFVLMAGMVGFAFFSLFTAHEIRFFVPKGGNLFLYLVPIASVAGVMIGSAVFKKKLSTINSKPSLKAKLSEYQTAIIIRYALIEAPVFFGLVAVMVKENFLYFLFSGMLLLYFITLIPSKDKIIDDLNLKDSLLDQFNDEDKIVS